MNDVTPENSEHASLSVGWSERKPDEFDLYVGVTLCLAVLYNIVVVLPYTRTLSSMASSVLYWGIEILACVGIMKGSRLGFTAFVVLFVATLSGSSVGYNFEFARAYESFSDVQKTLYSVASFLFTLGAIYCAGRLANAFAEKPVE